MVGKILFLDLRTFEHSLFITDRKKHDDRFVDYRKGQKIQVSKDKLS